MRYLLIVLLITIVTLFPLMLYSRKYRNPYKLIMIFGKKGSGKSTLLTRLAVNNARSGKVVYSNMPINYPGIRLFDVEDIGRYTFPENSVVFVDEVGSIWDNRNFRAFRPEVRDWFKLQRKHHVTVYLFSQTFDIDLKLRNLTDLMFMCTSHMNIFSIARRVNRKLVIVEPTGDSEGRITDGYEIQPLIFQLFGLRSIYFTFIPFYAKYFDTRFIEASKQVPEIDFEEVELPCEPEANSTPLLDEDSIRKVNNLKQRVNVFIFLRGLFNSASSLRGKARRRDRVK